ncbi:putative Cleavage stimulation factor subunit 2 [Hypsibius exemplaris]|uniref:Cleavage stimulation factor subunit 2 n=1 Tax=Hypsibius exemplaris TaxID=2072580 RepID=A0A1W0WYJ7_HYPEX|nr:putative Cleavage stimulation factor subunit 2 [Hypsibius exemplaris]
MYRPDMSGRHGQSMPAAPQQRSSVQNPPWNAAFAGPGGLDPNCKTIRIKNLVLDASEEDLRRIFSQLGVVADLWVVIDSHEHQSGVAYCEFQDSRAVEVAVSHLNGVSFKGYKIQIEACPNHVWKSERSKVLQAMEEMTVVDRNGRSHEAELSANDGQSSEDPSSDLTNLNSADMFNLMHQMKLCIEASRDQAEARNALLRNFTLSAGMLQALLMMKLVDPQEALILLMRGDAGPSSSSSASAPTTTAASHFAATNPPPVIQNPPLGYSARPPPPLPLDPRQARMAQQQAAHTQAHDPYAAHRGGGHHPQPVNPPYQQPPPSQSTLPPSHSVPATSQQQAAQLQPDAAANQAEVERAQMLLQLIQMTDAQLASLPPDQRQAVMMLRDQLSRQMP